MAKVKTAELIGPALNWAMSTALGYRPLRDVLCGGREFSGWCETAVYVDSAPNEYRRVPDYQGDWSEGGPITDQHLISTYPNYIRDGSGRHNGWVAAMKGGETQAGPTKLIAAMRCFVASRLGDEVDIPEELL